MLARRQMAATVVAVALTVALGGCGEEASTVPEGVTAAELNDPAAFDLDEAEAGQRVSLRVTVEEVLSPDSFVVPPQDGGSGRLLVLSEQHRAERGDVLQVGGLLRVFSYEDQALAFELDAAEQYSEFDAQLVLLATLVDEDLPLDDQ